MLSSKSFIDLKRCVTMSKVHASWLQPCHYKSSFSFFFFFSLVLTLSATITARSWLPCLLRENDHIDRSSARLDFTALQLTVLPFFLLWASILLCPCNVSVTVLTSFIFVISVITLNSSVKQACILIFTLRDLDWFSNLQLKKLAEWWLDP